MAFSPWSSHQPSLAPTLLTSPPVISLSAPTQELQNSWSYQPVHHAFCMEALEHWRRSCERLAQQLRLEALRNALLQWQDLVISERLTVRFAHAAQLIKMGPVPLGSSPTSSPGTRKSRIEVRRKSEMRRPPDEGCSRQLQALDVARRYALGALAVRKTLLHWLARRLQKTMAIWRHVILPAPLRQLLSHTRGDGCTAAASMRWRALSGSNETWLRRRAEESQVSHDLHHHRQQHCFLATRLLRSVLRLAVQRVLQGSWRRWRSTMAQAKDSSIAQVPRVSAVFSASKRGPSGSSVTSAPGATIAKEQSDLHAPLTHASQFLPWGRQPHQELSQKQLFEHLAAKHGSSEAALQDLREAVATALKDHPPPRRKSLSEAPMAANAAKLRL